ncbi:MAG: HAMP domain-containing protein [Deltaproteobacteria bacterium]|nr:HAMP domain-containing protein [Deltaproteobacteria bacterium]
MEIIGQVETDIYEKRRRKRERYIILITIAAIILLTALEIHLSGPEDVPFSGNIIIFSLININIILLLLVIFLVIRNLVKLLFERRQKILGSRLRVRLVAAFVTLSIIPTMLLFFSSVSFLSTSIKNWFDTKMERSLNDALTVAQTYYQHLSDQMELYAQNMASGLSEKGLKAEDKPEIYREYLMKKQGEYSLSLVEWYFPDGRRMLLLRDKALTDRDIPLIEKESHTKGISGEKLVSVSSSDFGYLVRAVVPLYANALPGKVIAVLSAGRLVPTSMVERLTNISRAMERYQQTKMLENPIKISYILVLTIVTLLIIFSATWFGFYLAKQITVPMQHLAEATQRVAQGDLDFEIAEAADDELGTLVDSFNTMTRDLRNSQQRLSKVNIDLRLMNLELDQRNRYMEIILREVAAGVVSLDAEGNITTINKSAESMLGIRARDVLHKQVTALMTSYRPMMESFMDEVRASPGSTVRREISLIANQEPLTLRVSASTLSDEDGNYLGLVVVFDDITQLQKAQRAAAWREVARRIAHEIKNPLTPIRLSAQRLLKRHREQFQEDGRVFNECIDTILNQVDTLKKLVNEFSSFARLPSAHFSPNDLNTIIEEVLVPYQESEGQIMYRHDLQGDLPILDLDPEQIKRALMNLLNNATTAVQEGGEVVIRTRYDPGLRIVTLEVSDNGNGIPKEDMERIFEPYFSTKKSGMGLGLAIVNTIVSDHNGYIRVKAREPKGTTFTIEFPVKR